MQWTGNLAVHFAFEVAGYFAGAMVYAVQRSRRGDTLSDSSRATVFTGAAFGAMVGARLLFFLCDPAHNSFFGGKTVVGGLLGGLIGVEIAKKLAGIQRSSGDLFVNPLIVAMCIGRIGCFLTGPIDRTAGDPTSLPWGIAIGDNIRRHPVALYEIAFLIALFFVLRSMRFTHEGDSFRLFMSAYLAFRLAVDFIKPDPPPLFFGITAIQYACVAGLLYYALVFTNDERSAAVPFLRRRRVGLHDVLPQD